MLQQIAALPADKTQHRHASLVRQSCGGAALKSHHSCITTCEPGHARFCVPNSYIFTNPLVEAPLAFACVEEPTIFSTITSFSTTIAPNTAMDYAIPH